MLLGIGVITFKRPHALARTVSAIRRHTELPYTLVVAEDGARDGAVEWCRQRDVPVITGQNHGVCWNKNRALFALMTRTAADQILLLEDDCFPTVDGWDVSWRTATARYAHVNYAHPRWPSNWRRGGNGLPDDPWLSWEITGQATGCTHEAIEKVGYLNTSFRGYGYGHIEWTERFCKAGLIARNTVPCIRCGLEMEDTGTFGNQQDVQRNYWLAQTLRTKPFAYCPAWSSPAEEARLNEEVAAAFTETTQHVLG